MQHKERNGLQGNLHRAAEQDQLMIEFENKIIIVQKKKKTWVFKM